MLSVLIVGFTGYLLHDVKLKQDSSSWKIFSHVIECFKSALGQSSNLYIQACCIKHILLFATSLFCFSCLIKYFGTWILINLLHDLSIKINSIDELVEFIATTKTHIRLVCDKRRLTWKLLATSKEEKLKTIFSMLNNADDTKPQMYR